MLHRTLWPDVPVWRDIRQVMGEQIRRGVGEIDCIVGSPPCQDASSANPKGRGIDGPETGLFGEAVRLVRELRPRWACFENSANLRSQGVDKVLGWLEEMAYSCWPIVVGADDLGAPHKRKRVWIVAHANGKGQSRLQGRGKAPHASVVNACQADAPDTSHGEQHRRGALGRWCRGQEAVERAGLVWDCPPWLASHPWNGGFIRHLRVADGLPAWAPAARLADCRSCYGDAVVPQVVEAIGRAILSADEIGGCQSWKP